MAPKSLITLDHVGHSFDDGRIVALKDVNLTIAEERIGGDCRGKRQWQVDANPASVRHQGARPRAAFCGETSP